MDCEAVQKENISYHGFITIQEIETLKMCVVYKMFGMFRSVAKKIFRH